LACPACGSLRKEGSGWKESALIKAVKKHPQYYTLQGVMGLSVLVAAIFGLHATQDPEVVWRHHSNPEPWNDYANKQYKLWSAGRDYSQGCPAPRYK
jgi:NADH dehydrogenase (ubiquinone) 1 alpha subcomplex subunit 4